MTRRAFTVMAIGLCCLGLLTLQTGCSGMGAAMHGGKFAMNLMKGGSKLDVYLDGQEAKQSMLKKGLKGYSPYEVKDPVSTAPTLRFTMKDPEKFGRVTSTIVSIHQEFEGDYSHQAEFTIAPKDNTAATQMKPDTDYDLGNPPDTLQVRDVRGNPVPGVKLTPGLKYQLCLTLRADRSETIGVFFEAE